VCADAKESVKNGTTWKWIQIWWDILSTRHYIHAIATVGIISKIIIIIHVRHL